MWNPLSFEALFYEPRCTAQHESTQELAKLRRPHLECPVFLRQQKPQNQVRNFASGSQTWAYCGAREYMKQEQTGPATPSYFSVRLQKTQERVSMSQKLSSCPNNT